MKSLLLSLAALTSLVTISAEARHFHRHFRPRVSFGMTVSTPAVYRPVVPCYNCYTPVVYRPMVYQPVVYRPVARPHVGFSFGTHGAGFSFWS